MRIYLILASKWRFAIGAAALLAAAGVFADPSAPSDAALEKYYAKLDAQIGARNGRKIWTPAGDLRKAVEAAAPAAEIRGSACAEDFCSFDLRMPNEATLNEFPQKLVQHPDVPGEAVMRYYKQTDPLLMRVYILKPRANRTE